MAAPVAKPSAARFAVDTASPSGGGSPDVDAESRLAPFSGENSLAAENARLTMLLHEQLGVTRAMEQQVAELGARWGERRSAYEAQISKLEARIGELERQLRDSLTVDGFWD